MRLLVATLEAADWTVEPTTIYADDLRVLYRGKNRCPSTYAVHSEGRQYCTRWRDQSDEHQDDRTLHQWVDDAPQPPPCVRAEDGEVMDAANAISRDKRYQWNV